MTKLHWNDSVMWNDTLRDSRKMEPETTPIMSRSTDSEINLKCLKSMKLTDFFSEIDKWNNEIGWFLFCLPENASSNINIAKNTKHQRRNLSVYFLTLWPLQIQPFWGMALADDCTFSSIWPAFNKDSGDVRIDLVPLWDRLARRLRLHITDVVYQGFRLFSLAVNGHSKKTCHLKAGKIILIFQCVLNVNFSSTLFLTGGGGKVPLWLVWLTFWFFVDL